ncbi:hypothetical protein [Methanotorris igneus]|uniref:hypothetical protein n=1 Tax=Methanotorris igneus TaxID=2189 RepID=UPI001FDFDC93|nr:hypothetical protein [Methanotorris igneus]
MVELGVKSIIQMLLFLGVSFYLIWKKLILTEFAILGTIVGLIIHWSLTNKGNKDIINIKPLGAGFRVLFYDIYLATIFIRGFLDGFSYEILFWIGILVLLITMDYFVEG